MTVSVLDSANESVTSIDSVRPVTEHELIETLVARHGAPLMILDCDRIRQQYRDLQAALPNVRLHFALKPFPHSAVVRALAEEGASFDLATNGEVDMVAAENIAPDRTIHTHPIKRDKDIRHALEYGCTTFVVDSVNELEKFIPYREQVELLVRLSFRNEEAYADLSKKFGCTPQSAMRLIQQAFDWGIRVKGLSFHVGSQTLNAYKYVEAIEHSLKIILHVSRLGLPALNTLDIGGGFPVDYGHNNGEDTVSIDTFCAPIRDALATLPETVNVLAEPGRFIVAPAVTNVSSVMGQAKRDGKIWYYLDDGIYGSFSGIMFDHGRYPVDALNWQGERFASVLAGPTCDSVDVISEDIMLPKLNNGDLIISRMMGAYSSATATEFNFFPKAEVVVLNEIASSAVTNLAAG